VSLRARFSSHFHFSTSSNLCLLTLALLALLQGLSGAVKSVTVVAAELGVDTLEGRVTVGLGLLDTVTVSLLAGVVLGRVLGLGHLDEYEKLKTGEETSARKDMGITLTCDDQRTFAMSNRPGFCLFLAR